MKIKSLKIKQVLLKCLDISMAHITDKDRRLLLEHYLSSYNSEYGIVVCIPIHDKKYFNKKRIKEHIDGGFSKNLLDIFIWALETGCQYVMFDRDGTEYEDLETFN